MQRENFTSRLGFLLVSAGCAIGIGNVWRFPTITGQNGGGVFVLFYLLFLLLMGVPVLTMELAVGRSGQGTATTAYRALEPKGSKWHIHGWFCLLGCCVLMMYYTTVNGWMGLYFIKFLAGAFEGMAPGSAGAARSHAFKGTGQELDEIQPHPAIDRGVVHHQHAASQQAKPAVDMPLAALGLQGTISRGCGALTRAAHSQLHGQYRNAHQQQKQKIEQHKYAAAVLTRDGGEAPYIANADGTASADQKETEPGSEVFALHLERLLLL